MTITETHMIIDEEALTEVVASIWEIMFDAEIEPDPTASVEAGPSASISICGAGTTTLIVTLDPTLATEAAASLMMVSVAELETTDLHDALGELVNIAGGNLKGLFGQELDLSLTIPVVSDSALQTKGSPTSVAMGFNVSGLAMVWQLHYLPLN